LYYKFYRVIANQLFARQYSNKELRLYIECKLLFFKFLVIFLKFSRYRYISTIIVRTIVCSDAGFC